jgi:FixJ family two-component response regulator
MLAMQSRRRESAVGNRIPGRSDPIKAIAHGTTRTGSRGRVDGGGQTPQQVPTVFVVDDDVDLRDSLRTLVQSVGLAAEVYPNATVFLENLTGDRPGCLVLDVRLPGMSGLELQKELIARGIDIPIIMTTGYPDVSVAVEAMKAGAADFIEKPFSLQRILDSIQRAIAQQLSMRRDRAQREEIHLRLAQLSRRERQVARMVANGMTSSAIASRLGLQKKTVEVYRSHINKKMGARNVADLVRMVQSVSE